MKLITFGTEARRARSSTSGAVVTWNPKPPSALAKAGILLAFGAAVAGGIFFMKRK